KTRGIQRTDGFTHTRACQMIADVDRQVVVDGAFGYALQTLDAYVADGKVRIVRGLCLGQGQRAMRIQGNGGQDGASLHASLTNNFLSRALRAVGFRSQDPLGCST